MQPRVIYTHNPADKHDTHIGVMVAVVEAVRALPPARRPQQLLGCEVWRGLDWMVDQDKQLLPVGGQDHLFQSLVGLFDSQIAGGKRYDLATLGRARANATYHQSHQVDASDLLWFRHGPHPAHPRGSAGYHDPCERLPGTICVGCARATGPAPGELAMEVIIQPDAEAVGRYAARVVTRVMRGRSAPVLGLATGTTPLPLYQELIRRHREEGLDFSACSTSTWTKSSGCHHHPQSYRSFMQEHLLSRINVAPDRVHIPDGMAEDIATACADYEEAIRKAGGIDVQVLGIGTRGHIGFNEPTSSCARAPASKP